MKLEISKGNLKKDDSTTNWFIERIYNWENKDIFNIRKRGVKKVICTLEIKDNKLTKLSGTDLPKFLFYYLHTLPINNKYKNKQEPKEISKLKNSLGEVSTNFSKNTEPKRINMNKEILFNTYTQEIIELDRDNLSGVEAEFIEIKTSSEYKEHVLSLKNIKIDLYNKNNVSLKIGSKLSFPIKAYEKAGDIIPKNIKPDSKILTITDIQDDYIVFDNQAKRHKGKVSKMFLIEE